jgi:hypothetical protein
MWKNNRLIQKLNADILYLIDLIDKKHPELNKYLNELPIIIPYKENPEISISDLKSYRETLAQFVKANTK